jgi:ApaG protein
MPAVYTETTEAIRISVQALFLGDRSEPDDDQYFWAYHIRIENTGTGTVQLLTRHWKIVDMAGHEQNVIGDGVIGDQPVLAPGQAFEYASGTSLSAPSGFMSGHFRMISQTGTLFDAIVPAFSLDSPFAAHPVH